MKILAIDLGSLRTGLAFCDKNETLAMPLATICETNKNKLIEKILEQIQKLKIEMIVIGNPINMNGSTGLQSKNCEKFANWLKQCSGLPVNLWDERQTTTIANRIMTSLKTKKKHKKNLVDKIAATLILESYLKFRKNNKLNNLSLF